MSTLQVTNIKATGETASRAVSGVAAAWSHTTFSGGTPTNQGSLNVSSLTDVVTGVTTWAFSSAFSNTNFEQGASAQFNDTSGTGAYFTMVDTSGRSSSVCRQDHYQQATLTDPTTKEMVCHGDLA